MTERSTIGGPRGGRGAPLGRPGVPGAASSSELNVSADVNGKVARDGREPPPSEPVGLVRERARARVRVVAGCLCVLVLASGARGIQLGAEPSADTLEIATDKRWAAVTIQGPRGEIRDAAGNVLATSVPTPAVFVDPATVRERCDDLEAVARDLSAVLKMPAEQVMAALNSQGRYVRLARGVHPSVAEELTQLGLTSKGLIIEDNWRRYYPEGGFAGQVIGYVDEAGRGVQGLEGAFESELVGARLVEQQRVNRRGRALELATRNDRDVQGMTVYTTLDPEIQHLTEKALLGVMERHDPEWAAAVVMEVRTGRVVAMATMPAFDPNTPTVEDFGVMRNRTIMDPVEPGSVFKPFTYAAALEEGVISPDEVMTTSSPWVVGGARIRDDHPHSHMLASEVVKYSSNVGSAQMAHRVGSKKLLSFFEAFGFGAVTGVQLTAEEPGKRSPPRVGPVELATISYGQGSTSTLLQLVTATAALGNGGLRMRPMLVDRVEDSWGLVRQAWEPTVVARAVSPETAQLVADAMSHVTDADSTAPRAAIPGYKVAGKTGTAYKVVDGRYHPTARYAGFMGFAPADRPDLAMAILVDDPKVGSRYGGVVSGPVFAEVMGPALRLRGVPPDPTAPVAAQQRTVEVVAAPPAQAVVAWSDGGWVMPDLTGRDLRGALAALQGTGLSFTVDGSGFLASQHPPAGARVAVGERVTLQFH